MSFTCDTTWKCTSLIPQTADYYTHMLFPPNILVTTTIWLKLYPFLFISPSLPSQKQDQWTVVYASHSMTTKGTGDLHSKHDLYVDNIKYTTHSRSVSIEPEKQYLWTQTDHQRTRGKVLPMSCNSPTLLISITRSQITWSFPYFALGSIELRQITQSYCLIMRSRGWVSALYLNSCLF